MLVGACRESARLSRKGDACGRSRKSLINQQLILSYFLIHHPNSERARLIADSAARGYSLRQLHGVSTRR
jgi:hypothetical protein